MRGTSSLECYIKIATSWYFNVLFTWHQLVWSYRIGLKNSRTIPHLLMCNVCLCCGYLYMLVRRLASCIASSLGCCYFTQLFPLLSCHPSFVVMSPKVTSQDYLGSFISVMHNAFAVKTLQMGLSSCSQQIVRSYLYYAGPFVLCEVWNIVFWPVIDGLLSWYCLSICPSSVCDKAYCG